MFAKEPHTRLRTLGPGKNNVHGLLHPFAVVTPDMA